MPAGPALSEGKAGALLTLCLALAVPGRGSLRQERGISGVRGVTSASAGDGNISLRSLPSTHSSCRAGGRREESRDQGGPT